MWPDECSRNSSWSAASRIVALAAAMLALLSLNAEAGFITIDPAGMNEIFSQPSFDGTPVDIRFNSPRLIVDPGLLDVNNQAQLTALVDLAPDPAPTVDTFFVDQVNFCSFEDEAVINGSFNGCAQLPGHVFVEDSDAAELSPATLMGHELGHNLNLQHTLADPSNLMNFLFPHGTMLTEEQVAIILQSPLVQTDPTGQKFIQITPIAIVATSEPTTLLLLGGSLGMLLIATAINRVRARLLPSGPSDDPPARGRPKAWAIRLGNHGFPAGRRGLPPISRMALGALSKTSAARPRLTGRYSEALTIQCDLALRDPIDAGS